MSLGVPVFQCCGVFRCSGVPVFRCFGDPGFSTYPRFSLSRREGPLLAGKAIKIFTGVENYATYLWILIETHVHRKPVRNPTVYQPYRIQNCLNCFFL